MSIVSFIEKSDILLEKYGEAFQLEEKRIRALHPEPPEAPEWRDDFTEAEKENYSASHDAVHTYFMAMIRMAKAAPHVQLIVDQRNVLVAKVLEKLGPISSEKTVGAVPGLGCCPKCGSPCIAIPNIMDEREHNAHRMMALCIKSEEHLVKWLPWGG